MKTSAATPDLAWVSALADVTRVRLLRLLERHELAVSELCAVLQLPQSTVSRHLKTLASEGWVGSRREGTSRLYRMEAHAQGPAGQRLWAALSEKVAASPAARQDDQRLERALAERRSRSRAFFASSAGRWDRLREELFGRGFDVRALLGLLDERWAVGDLGCGTGGVSEALAPFVARLIAVDDSSAMLQAARKRLAGHANVELRQGELERLPIEDGELDVALLFLVLHHLAHPLAALEEAARALKPHGRLLVVDMQPHDREEYRAQMGHQWLGFSREQATALLGQAGFEAVRWIPLPPDLRAKGPPLFAGAARRRAQVLSLEPQAPAAR